VSGETAEHKTAERLPVPPVSLEYTPPNEEFIPLDGESALMRLVAGARRGRTDEEIEHDVEQLIKDTFNEPKSSIYFDPNDGWVVPPYALERVQRDVHLRTLGRRRRDEE
jgi:hypothetical protein